MCCWDDHYACPGYNPEQKDAQLLAALRGHGCRETRFEFGSTGLMFEGMESVNVSQKTAVNYTLNSYQLYYPKLRNNWPPRPPLVKMGEGGYFQNILF